jgi:hypothetical protein
MQHIPVATRERIPIVTGPASRGSGVASGEIRNPTIPAQVKPGPDINGQSPLQQPQFQRTEKEQGFLNEGLLDASRKGESSRLKYLLRSGAELEARDAFGRTPLMLAIIAGRREAAEILLQNNADANAKDAVYEWSVLIHAIHTRNLEMVKLLADNGADPGMSCGGWTPFSTARFYDSVTDSGIYEFLRQRGAR